MDYSFWGALLRVIIFLPLVAGLAYFIIKYGLTKKYLRFEGRYIQVIEQAALTPKTSVNIIKVGDEYFLIGASENQVTFLKKLEGSFESPHLEDRQSFASLLKKLKKGGGSDE